MKTNSGQFKTGEIPWNKKLALARVCPKCDKKFEVKPSLARIICCSRRCARLGKTTSPRQKMIISELLKGNKYRLGQPAWNKGLVGFRAGIKRVGYPRGEKNWAYIKDRSLIKHQDRRNNPLYKEWRMNVWMRDYFKCKISDDSCAGRIEAHHILGYTRFPELRYKINNGITLCHAHHPRKRDEEIKFAPFFQRIVQNNILVN